MDKLTKEKRSWNMSRIRAKNTKPEIILRSMLHRKGYRFRINHKGLPGKPDVVLPKYRSVIFVHGCFWHGHEGCKDYSPPKTRTEWWINKIKGNIKKDKENTKQIKKQGWQVIIVWECELATKNREKLIKTITNRLN